MLFTSVWLLLVMVFDGTGVRCMEKTSMYMKRSEISDQAMSGSGYSYNGDDGKPLEYSFEVGDNGGQESFRILKGLGYDPFVESQRYAEVNDPLPYEQYSKEYSTAADYQPASFYVNDYNHKIPQVKVPVAPYPHINEYRKLGLYPKYPYAAGYGHHNSNFLKSAGKSYNDFDSAKFGEKFDSGYKTIDAFNKGLHGKYDSNNAKSYYDQLGGKKQLNYDNAGNYASKSTIGKASQGGSFGQKDSHNKGSKTTGYHKKYHKDDYNKQHSFYDKADRRGNFKKYGDYDAKHGDSEGHFLKGGHFNGGYASDKYGAKGLSDKGKFEEVAKGFKKGDGSERFYKDYAEFSKRGGEEGGSKGGYSI